MGELLYKFKQRIDVCVLKHLAGLTRWNDRDRSILLASLEKEVGGNDEIVGCAYENKSGDGGRPDLSDTFAAWPNVVFRLVSGRFYHCVDAESMAVRILAQLLRRVNLEVHPLIEMYLNNRKQIFDRVRAETSISGNRADREIKHAFLAVLNLKSLQDEWFDCPTMREWSAVWNKNVDLLRKKTVCSYDYNNPSFLAWLWNVEERKCMTHAIEFLQLNNQKVGVYKFDEVGIEEPFSDQLIHDLEAHIKMKTGFEVVFKRKNVLPTKEDYDIFYSQRTFCSFDKTKKNEIDYATWQLVLAGYTRKAIRYEGHVLSAHPTVPGVYVWQEDAKTYISNILQGNSYVQTFPVDIEKLVKWFNENDHSGFPLKSEANMKTEWISFKDCTFNTDECKLYRYDELPSPPFTDHFYDVNIYGTDLADASLTPHWTKVLSTQLSAKVSDFFEAMIGRLQFTVGRYDGWQIMPFMLGTASTGKGTILSAIKRMKPDGRVGSISQNFESVFGLDPLKHKSVVICWDMPLDMPRRLNQATLQSMVSGEGVSIPAKYKKAETTMDWKIPMIWASNSLPNYKDTQGQISRRLCVFRFNTPVAQKDHTLNHKVMSEVPIVLLRCIGKYRALVERAENADFWKEVAPEDCKAEKENLAQQADYMRLFLNEGSMKYMAVYKKGCTVSYRHLQAVVLEFLRDEQKQHRLRFDDLGTCALEEKFVIRKRYKDAIYVCTHCNTHGSDVGNCNSKCIDDRCFNVHKKEFCKTHYRADLRRKITCVENMQLIPRDRYERQEVQKEVEERATKKMKTDITGAI